MNYSAIIMSAMLIKQLYIYIYIYIYIYAEGHIKPECVLLIEKNVSRGAQEPNPVFPLGVMGFSICQLIFHGYFIGFIYCQQI
jgi:hypothetical protein